MRIFISLSGKELIVKGSRVAVRHGKDYWLATVNKRGADGTIAITYDEGTKDPSLSLRSGVTHLPDGTKASKKPLTREQVHAIVLKVKADASKVFAVKQPKPTVKPKTPAAAEPKTTTRAKTGAKAHSLENVDANVLRSLKNVAHENGSGGNRSSIHSAIDNLAKGTATSKDLLTMVQTNNYGGPVGSYRASVPKSQIDPKAVDLIKRATAHARKMAPAVVQKESQEVAEHAGKLLDKYKGEDGAKAFAKMLKAKHPKMATDDVNHFTKWFSNVVAKPTVGSLASDTAAMLSVLPEKEYAEIDKLRDKAHFVDRLSQLTKK